MAKLAASSTSTTDMTNAVTDFSVDSKNLDHTTQGSNETIWDFSEAVQNLGYYFEIPELKKAIDALATWTTGKGWDAGDDMQMKVRIDNLDGWGEDTFQNIMWNMIVMKKIVGDSFAEIIRENGKLVNLKTISPERVRLILNKQGRIKRYDVRKESDGLFKAVKREDMLHLSNDRVGDQIHGTSVIDACKWVIDARNEAMNDERMIRHRELAMGVLEIDTDDPTKRNQITKQYQTAVDKGEVLVLPKGLAELKDANVTPRDRLEWIRYLENFFYQAVGIPKIILGGADQHTEAGGKIGYLTFEPVYVQEQTQLEGDLMRQIGIKIKLNRPASLGGTIQDDETKNTGQVAIQPNDVEATLTPE